MLNGLRNILTALWCAVLLAGFGYPLIAALRTSGVSGLDMATVSGLPLEMIVSIGGAVSALASMIYVPVLFVFVVFAIAAGFVAVLTADPFQRTGAYVTAGLYGLSAMISLSLAIWDIKHRRKVKNMRVTPVEEF